MRPMLLALAFLLLVAMLVTAPAHSTSSQESLRVHLRAASFDPLAETALASSPRDTLPATDNLMLVQFVGPVEDRWKQAIERAGARLYAYIPDYAFLARVNPNQIDAVRALPEVRWVGPYQSAFRLSPDLPPAQMAGLATKEPRQLAIVAVPDSNLAALSREIVGLGGTVEASSVNSLAVYLRVTLPASQIQALSHLAGVIWVEPYIEPQLMDDVATGPVMRVQQARQALGLYGAGQVIGIADSGLSTGDPATLHPDVRGRLLRAYCLGRPSPCDWSDANGHGTHVAGSALGNGALSGSNPAARQFAGSFAGSAPEAHLVFQSIVDTNGELTGLPGDYRELMRSAYIDGARIHTNSWGGPSGSSNGRAEYGGYTLYGQQVDQAASELPDMLILFSAGNKGVDRDGDRIVDPDSIGDPGTAKNILTIGASENHRPDRSITYASAMNFPPFPSDLIANNPNGMAAFSSRGPTDDGRIKPDLVAPGTQIVSLSTPGLSPSAPYNEHYHYLNGTSMATPLVAGAAALVREWLQVERGIERPSGALMKAVLINGAADMGTGQYGPGLSREIPAARPNNVSGWGRVDLAESLAPPNGRRVLATHEGAPLSTGQAASFTVPIGGAAQQSSPAIIEVPAAVVEPQAVSELLRNGGFEQAGAGWTQEGFSFPGVRVRTGAGSAATTPGANGLLRQQVVFPTTLSSVTFSYGVDSTGFDLFDSLEICLRRADSGGSFWCVSEYGTVNNGWRVRTHTFDAVLVRQLAGQRVELSFRMRQNGQAPSIQFFVDDVALTVDDGQPLPTLPPPAPPAALELVRDGTFEGDGSAWARREASYTTTRVRSGFSALAFTPGLNAELSQTISFPQQIAGVTVHYGIAGVDMDLFDFLDICLYRSGTTSIIWCRTEYATAHGAWNQGSHALDQQTVRSLAGQTVDLVFRVTQNGQGVSTRFFLDDVSVAVDDGLVLPQPPPTRLDNPELIADGGFEGGGSAWARRDAQVSDASAFSGRAALSFLPGIDGYLRQTVTFPPTLASGTLSYAFRSTALDLFDGLEVCLYPSGTALPLWCERRPVILDGWEVSTDALEPSLLRRLAGQRIDLVFRQFQNGQQPSGQVFVDAVSLTVASGAEVLPIPVPPSQLRVTLAWTDAPGSPSAARALVNDLDLEIIGPDGTRLVGNQGAYSSGHGCLAQQGQDRCNNVEGIILPNAAPGAYTIRVVGANIPQGPQPFALVVSGAPAAGQGQATVRVSNGTSGAPGSVFALAGSNFTPGASVVVSVNGVPRGALTAASDGRVAVNVAFSRQARPGTYRLLIAERLADNALTGAGQAVVQVAVTADGPVLVVPSDQAAAQRIDALPTVFLPLTRG